MNKKGFTLIELMIVIIILAVLVAIALPIYVKAIERSKQTEAVANLGMIRDSEQRYYMQYGMTTSTLSLLDIGDPATYKSSTGIVRFNNYAIANAGTSLNALTFSCARDITIDYNTAFGLPSTGYSVFMNGATGNIAVNGF